MVSEESASETELLKIASADSSATSAESNFRELDDAFLQTQTRIWLGEVLQIRLDEQLIISELLADGELLFQVSKVVWKLLLAKHMELRHIKAYKTQPFASKKSGRYRPYSNVDSFLKICKILGLTGVDLFSPSDVVERRNTRKVCMCIRSFSKKSRSMNINVPDFDIVTCMVAMPKDLVGCIRRNIELSHSILADSSSHHLHKHESGKYRQGYSVTGSTRDYKAYSDHSDDTEIIHPDLQFDGLHTEDLYDYTSEINYNIPSPMIESVFMPEDLDQFDTQNQQRNEVSNDEFELLCSMESLQYHCSDNVEGEHNCKLSCSSSSSSGDLHVLVGMTSHLDTRAEQVQGSRIMDYVEHVLLRDNASVIGTPMSDKTPVTDATLYAKNKKDPDLFDEENSTPNVHQSASSHGSNPTPQTIENGRCFELCDNMEVLQEAGMSCLSKKALNLGDKFDAGNDFQNIESFKVHNDKNDQWEHEAKDKMILKDMAYGITSNARNSYFVKKFEETEHSLYSPDCYFCNTNSPDRAVPQSDDISSTLWKKSLAYEDKESQVNLRCLDDASCNCNQSEELLSGQSNYLPEFCKWDQKGKCAMTSKSNSAKDNKSSSCFLDDGSHEETTPSKQKASEVLVSKVMLPCGPNEEDAVSAAVIKLDTDGKELNNDYLAIASNTLVVDDCEQCPTLGDDTNNFSDKGVTTEDIGETNDAVVPANCDEDVSHTGSSVKNQSSKLECNDGHQAYQYNKDLPYHSEHTNVVHIKEEIKPEDESVHTLENLVETEEGAIEIPKVKPLKKLLLKSVLGGATAVGLLFMFLQLRRNDGEIAAEPSKESSDKDKEKIQQKYSARKVKRRSTAKVVYPAEKLQLK
ncbi:CH domain superfamily [Sesbania bispinosa]|nr:CH domain superfamily [Sesbania bispinosa]